MKKIHMHPLNRKPPSCLALSLLFLFHSPLLITSFRSPLAPRKKCLTLLLMRLMNAEEFSAFIVMAQSGVLLSQASKFLSMMMVLFYGKMSSLILFIIFSSASTSQLLLLHPLQLNSQFFTTSTVVDFALDLVLGLTAKTTASSLPWTFKLALDLQAVVISPDYRLAPENRLPAAVEDGYTAVKWLQAQAVSEEGDTWLTDVADFSKVFISGDSAGGNIAHNLAVRLEAGSLELSPVRVRSYVLLAPFFGGTVRSVSEAEGPKDAFLNLELIDRFWRLSIPIGDTTDHPLVNPFGPRGQSLEPVDLDPILVIVGESDLLQDRAKDYAERLKAWGKRIEYIGFEGKQHGFFTVDPNSEAANKLMLLIKRFISENSS